MSGGRLLEVLADADAVADRVAALVAEALLAAVDQRGRATLALSGGSTPVPMYARLAAHDEVPWTDVAVHQVDERLVADPEDPARNWTAILAGLVEPTGAVGRPLPLDPAEAAALEAPARLDVVHLGLGEDGHTASLVPGDPACEVVDADVAVTRPYRGHRRATLTAPAINRAGRIVWHVVGEAKREALAALLAGGTGIPADLVRAHPDVLVVADAAAVAHGQLPGG